MSYAQTLLERRWRRIGASQDVLFALSPFSNLASLGATFTRADATTCARYRDSAGIWQVVAANVLRNQHFPIPATQQSILLEPSRVNSALGACSFGDNTYWTQAADFTIATATSCISGQTAYKHTAIGAGKSRPQSIGTFVNGQTDCLCITLENVDTTLSTLTIYDYTAGAVVHSVRLTWASLSVAIVVGSGTSGVIDLGTGPNGGRLVRLWITATGTAAGNTRRMYLAIADDTKACIIHHAQFEANASFPTSPIVTVGSAVTRAIDDDSFAYSAVPQASCGVIKFVSGQKSNYGGEVIQQIGSNAGARLVISKTSGAATLTILHNNGSSSVSTTVACAVTTDDTVEVFWWLYATGSVNIGVSINGAAVVMGAASAANALAAAWGALALRLNEDATPANAAGGSYQKVSILTGTNYSPMQLSAA